MTTSDMTTPERDPINAVPAAVDLGPGIASDLADYARAKIAVVLGHTGRTALRVRVRVLRHADPAREHPVDARASVVLAGETVHVHADGDRPRETVDLLVARLDRRIGRLDRGPRRSGGRLHPPVPPAADVQP